MAWYFVVVSKESITQKIIHMRDDTHLGLDEVDDGVMGSGLVEWDFGMTEPVENVDLVPYKGFEVHRTVRMEAYAQ